MIKWQPIETAPKDGSTILLIQMDAEEPEASACAWHDLFGDAGFWRVGCPFQMETDFPAPTHWLPMPGTQTFLASDNHEEFEDWFGDEE